MKISNLLTIVLIAIIVTLYCFNTQTQTINYADTVYQVYLSGKSVGTIYDEEELYSMINEEQQEIKDAYDISTVYPPSNLEIIEVSSYTDEIVAPEEIYSLIENNDNFTIEGYEITITDNTDPDNVVKTSIFVIDKEVFTDAIEDFVNAYIDVDLYYNYINDEQEEIVYTGLVIDEMYFKENISIKESYISVDNKIYTDSEELLSYLIFGESAKILDYEIEAGDTIASIADDNQLSVSEFLIGNPSYRDEETMLQIGDTVNVTLQDPIINFVYTVTETEELEIDFVNTTIYDGDYDSSYSEITTEGVVGLELVTMAYEVTNGIQSQEIERVDSKVIRESVNQVTTLGAGYSNTTIASDYIYTGLDFTLPVESGFIVTSPFGEWRSSYYHNGTDFSGTGYGSDIYAIADGVVTQASDACSSCSAWSFGTYIVISHGNNYYSTYMHMVVGSIKVSVGDTVVKGQLIGAMGSTGNSTGTHLHLGFSVGEPLVTSNVTYYDAYKLIYGQW